MAHKKRKAAKRSANIAPASPQFFGGWGAVRLLPLLGALALVFSWLAALGGMSDGTMDLRFVFNNDTLWPYGIFRDAVLDDGYPMSGWGVGPAPYYFPDYALLWPLFALFGPAAGTHVFSLLQVFLAAVGWILVCDRVFGKSPVRRCVVLLLHAATFLILAWRESGLFMLQLTGVWHYGAWMCLPWLLWLSLRMMEVPSGGRLVPANVAALVLAVAVAVPSDLVLAPWFVGPAAAAAALSARPKNAGIFAAALAAGMVLGWTLYKFEPLDNPNLPGVSGSNYNPALFERNLRLLWRPLSHMARIDPMEFLLLPAFAAAMLWQLAGEFSAWKRGRREERGEFFHARRFVLLFIPLSVAGAAAGGVLHGLSMLGYLHPIQDLRYVLPIVLFPLFVGWALLDFPRANWPPPRAVAAACVLAVLLSVPKAARLDFAALDPFETPFQKCFAQNARQREWTGVIAPGFYVLPMFLDPDAGMENYINLYAPQDKNAFQFNSFIANWRRGSGEFQVVAVNAHQGRLFSRPPRARDAGCPVSDPACLRQHINSGLPLSGGMVRAAFGDPAEIVECAGIGLYHYDPPLRFDFPENPDGTTIGRKF